MQVLHFQLHDIFFVSMNLLHAPQALLAVQTASSIGMCETQLQDVCEFGLLVILLHMMSSDS